MVSLFPCQLDLFFSLQPFFLFLDYAGDLLILCGDVELNPGPTSATLIMSDYLILMM